MQLPYKKEAANDRELVHELAEELQERMQDRLNRELANATRSLSNQDCLTITEWREVGAAEWSAPANYASWASTQVPFPETTD